MKTYQILIDDFPAHEKLLSWQEAIRSFTWFNSQGFESVELVDASQADT